MLTATWPNTLLSRIILLTQPTLSCATHNNAQCPSVQWAVSGRWAVSRIRTTNIKVCKSLGLLNRIWFPDLWLWKWALYLLGSPILLFPSQTTSFRIVYKDVDNDGLVWYGLVYWLLSPNTHYTVYTNYIMHGFAYTQVHALNGWTGWFQIGLSQTLEKHILHTDEECLGVYIYNTNIYFALKLLAYRAIWLFS